MTERLSRRRAAIDVKIQVLQSRARKFCLHRPYKCHCQCQSKPASSLRMTIDQTFADGAFPLLVLGDMSHSRTDLWSLGPVVVRRLPARAGSSYWSNLIISRQSRWNNSDDVFPRPLPLPLPTLPRGPFSVFCLRLCFVSNLPVVCALFLPPPINCLSLPPNIPLARMLFLFFSVLYFPSFFCRQSIIKHTFLPD